MIFEHIKLRLPLSDLAKFAPKTEVSKPKKKDYWEEQWQRMKHFTGAHIYETINSEQLFYQLGFMHGKLISVQINTTSDFTEAGYLALVTIGDQIVAANKLRALKSQGTPSSSMPWSELKDQRLAESGLPNDRYVICRSASWREGKIHSYLSIALEWPHVLALEYREETDES